MDHRDISAMLETAIVAARLAGQHAIEQMQFAKASVKGGQYRELVTQVDSQCQKIAVDRIKEAYPDHGFIAEEGDKGGIFKQPPRSTPSIWWAIDPIDGTNNYAHQLPIFCVSIAALAEGVPIVGVIFDPATDSMFTGAKDCDAQLNSRRINVSQEQMDEFSTVGIDSHFDWLGCDADWTKKIMAATRFRDIGSTALQAAYVARGSFIATVQPGPKLWDIAAGEMIVRAAGGITTDFDGNPLFPMDLENYTGQKFRTLISNKPTHPKILQLIRE